MIFFRDVIVSKDGVVLIVLLLFVHSESLGLIKLLLPIRHTPSQSAQTEASVIALEEDAFVNKGLLGALVKD